MDSKDSKDSNGKSKKSSDLDLTNLSELGIMPQCVAIIIEDSESRYYLRFVYRKNTFTHEKSPFGIHQPMKFEEIESILLQKLYAMYQNLCKYGTFKKIQTSPRKDHIETLIKKSGTYVTLDTSIKIDVDGKHTKSRTTSFGELLGSTPRKINNSNSANELVMPAQRNLLKDNNDNNETHGIKLVDSSTDIATDILTVKRISAIELVDLSNDIATDILNDKPPNIISNVYKSSSESINLIRKNIYRKSPRDDSTTTTTTTTTNSTNSSTSNSPIVTPRISPKNSPRELTESQKNSYPIFHAKILRQDSPRKKTNDVKKEEVIWDETFDDIRAIDYVSNIIYLPNIIMK